MTEPTLPTLNAKHLRKAFLDGNLREFDCNTLDAVARMLLEIDRTSDTMKIGLRHLTTKLSVGRADIGLGTQRDKDFEASVDYRCDNDQILSLVGVELPNRHPVFQRVWKSRSPIPYNDVKTNPLVADLRNEFETVGSKSMIAQRLEYRRNIFGIVCVDDVEDRRIWKDEERKYLYQFCQKFLGPIIQLSIKLNAKRCSGKPSPSELEAVRLSAQGYTYKQIALELDKSERTIETQLRNARIKTGATNQAELVVMCEPWL